MGIYQFQKSLLEDQLAPKKKKSRIRGTMMFDVFKIFYFSKANYKKKDYALICVEGKSERFTKQ